MGCGTSCSTRRVGNAEPYDARRLLSELVTVQTAIVLNEDFSAERSKLFSPAQFGSRGAGLLFNAQRWQEKEESNVPAADAVATDHTKVSESRRHSVEYTFSTSTCYGLPGFVESCDKGSNVDSQKLNDLSHDMDTVLSKRNSLPEQLIAETLAKMPSIQEIP